MSNHPTLFIHLNSRFSVIIHLHSTDFHYNWNCNNWQQSWKAYCLCRLYYWLTVLFGKHDCPICNRHWILERVFLIRDGEGSRVCLFTKRKLVESVSSKLISGSRHPRYAVNVAVSVRKLRTCLLGNGHARIVVQHIIVTIMRLSTSKTKQ